MDKVLMQVLDGFQERELTRASNWFYPHFVDEEIFSLVMFYLTQGDLLLTYPDEMSKRMNELVKRFYDSKRGVTEAMARLRALNEKIDEKVEKMQPR